MFSIEFKKKNLKKWNLIQISFFSKLAVDMTNIDSVIKFGKIFADLSDKLGCVPSFKEFSDAVSGN